MMDALRLVAPCKTIAPISLLFFSHLVFRRVLRPLRIQPASNSRNAAIIRQCWPCLLAWPRHRMCFELRLPRRIAAGQRPRQPPRPANEKSLSGGIKKRRRSENKKPRGNGKNKSKRSVEPKSSCRRRSGPSGACSRASIGWSCGERSWTSTQTACPRASLWPAPYWTTQLSAPRVRSCACWCASYSSLPLRRRPWPRCWRRTARECTRGARSGAGG